MKENLKKEYFAPMVEILNARVEKGFQLSATTGANEDLVSSGESHDGTDFD